MIDDYDGLYAPDIIWFFVLDQLGSECALFPEREECNWTYAQLMERTIALPLDYRIVTRCSN